MLFRRIIENPILVAVAMLLVTLMGILSVLRVPVQLIPDLDVRVVTIVTRWPGATPQDVEREILVALSFPFSLLFAFLIFLFSPLL